MDYIYRQRICAPRSPLDPNKLSSDETPQDFQSIPLSEKRVFVIQSLMYESRREALLDVMKQGFSSGEADEYLKTLPIYRWPDRDISYSEAMKYPLFKHWTVNELRAQAAKIAEPGVGEKSYEEFTWLQDDERKRNKRLREVDELNELKRAVEADDRKEGRKMK